MEYTVLSSRFMKDLIESVREHIARGWKPLGGMTPVSTGSVFGSQIFYQTMVRDNPQE